MNTLLIVLAHLMNFVFIVFSQEAIELPLNKLDDFCFCKPGCDWPLNIIVINNILKKIVILIHIDGIIIHVSFSHLTHSSPSHSIHLILIHILIIIAIKQSSRSSSPSISNLLILIELLINHHSLIHGEFFLLIIIESNIFIVIKFLLLSVILLHILHEIFALNLIFRVINTIVVINILLDVFLPDIAFFKEVIFTSFVVSPMVLGIKVVIVPTNKYVQG